MLDPNDLSPDDFANLEAVMPEPQDLQLDEEKLEFLFGYAPKMNFIVDSVFTFAEIGDTANLAGALSALMAMGFNAGIEYQNNQKKES